MFFSANRASGNSSEGFFVHLRKTVTVAHLFSIIGRRFWSIQSNIPFRSVLNIYLRQNMSFSFLLECEVVRGYNYNLCAGTEYVPIHDVPSNNNFWTNLLFLWWYLGRPLPCDVYKRLTNLEEKVLFLEGMSPEYFSQNVSSWGWNFRNFIDMVRLYTRQSFFHCEFLYHHEFLSVKYNKIYLGEN